MSKKINPYTLMDINAKQQQRIIRHITRRFEFPEWRKAYDQFEELLATRDDVMSVVRADLACALSALAQANNPSAMFYGQRVQAWNTDDV